MARPAKAVNMSVRHNTQAEKDIRATTEKTLRGDVGKLRPPAWLNVRQKKLFRAVIAELKEADILGNVDVYILSQFAVSVDRLWEIEERINADPELISDKDIMSAKDKYTKDFFRCCNELSLSPQARAKIGTLNVAKNEREANPLLQAIRGGGYAESEGGKP